MDIARDACPGSPLEIRCQSYVLGHMGGGGVNCTHERVSFCRRRPVVVVDADVAVGGGRVAAHVLNDGRDGRSAGLAKRLQQRRQGRLAGGQGRRQGTAERQKFLARHFLVDRNAGVVLYATKHIIRGLLLLSSTRPRVLFDLRTTSECKVWAIHVQQFFTPYKGNL